MDGGLYLQSIIKRADSYRDEKGKPILLTVFTDDFISCFF